MATQTTQEIRNWLYGGTCPKLFSQAREGNIRSKLTIAKFPIRRRGKSTTGSLQVHSFIADKVKNAITEIYNNTNFEINDTGAYCWRSVNGAKGKSPSLSMHGLGCAIDFNPGVNGWNASSGSNNSTQMRTTAHPVVQIMAKYGFAWGGNWRCGKDYMHFEYAGSVDYTKSAATQAAVDNSGYGGTSMMTEVPQGEVYTSDGADVLSGCSPYANSLNTQAVKDGETPIDLAGYDKFKYRIYQEFKPTINLLELSIPAPENSLLSESSNEQNAEEGADESASNERNAAEGTTNEDGANAQNPYNRKDAGTNEGIGKNVVRGAGKEFPIVKIRDRIFNYQMIRYFEIDHNGFVPILTLDIACADKSILKDNIIQEGSICSVFFCEDVNMTNNIILPVRADFRIIRSYAPDISQVNLSQTFVAHVVGELNIPSLHSSGETFAFSGTTRDALRDAAKKLSLGFCFNNPNNTNDVGIYQCQPTGTQGMDTYIEELTQHAWMDEMRFYDSWIDPRYNLCFIDINQQLGFEGVEPEISNIDVALITSTMENMYSADGNKAIPEDDISKSQWWAKMFVNFDDQEVHTRSPFKVIKYQIHNDATAITREIGLLRDAAMELQNSGLDPEMTDVNIGFKLAYNRDKVRENDPTCKFYILDGPGMDFTSGSNQSASTDYAKEEVYKSPSTDIAVQSDADAADILETGSNEFASGNVPKTYLVAMEHNLLNNKQLEKQYLLLTCQGLNTQILRGEKIPVMMLDKAFMSRFEGNENNPSGESSYSRVDPTASGWFIISGIKWIWRYDENVSGAPTSWITEVKLTRREWPIPLETVGSGDDSENIQVDVSNTSNTSVESQIDESVANAETASEDESTPVSGLSFDSLQPFIVETWKKILETTDNKATMISGKRWACGENGEKVEGNAFIKAGDKYKFIDSDGKTISWYSDYKSIHLYGCAIDFTCDAANIENIICSDDIIKDMYDKGLCILWEAQDAATGHYELSVRESARSAWWNTVIDKRGETIYYGGTIVNLKQWAKNTTTPRYTEIKHSTINEVQ